MRVSSKLAWIVAGYGLAFGAGIAAVAVNEFLIADDMQQTSGGMVAFGDMMVFVLASGVASLAPTWFLLKLCVEKNPRVLIAAELVLAAIGPASWLAVRAMAAGGPPQSRTQALGAAVGLFIAFGAIPRMVFGPVLLVIEATTIFLLRGRVVGAILAGAMLMDLIPLSLFAMHMVVASHR